MNQDKKYRGIIGSCNWNRIDINEEFRNAPIRNSKLMWEKSLKISPQKFNRKRK